MGLHCWARVRNSIMICSRSELGAAESGPPGSLLILVPRLQFARCLLLLFPLIMLGVSVARVYFVVVSPKSYLFMLPSFLMNLKRVEALAGLMKVSLSMIGPL
uniref:Uncharacterized protein n=1 Tax=Picea sitchensis TaxID=3332 RepID=A9NSQ0_PICSI|nr:unknown [Picea sitchensis]